MSYHDLSTAAIAAVFTNGVQLHGGRVTEIFDDGTQLFSRSLLPFVEEVRPADRMQGGLAVRATESEIWLHPYLFRQVCSNGAIMAHSLESSHVEYSEFAAEDEVVRELHDAIVACCEQEVFVAAVDKVRTSVNTAVDIALALMPLVSRLRDATSVDLIMQIVQQFSSGQDQSRFSLMNAITSVARDTRDPEQRWRLEELGGAVGAGVTPTQPTDGLRAQRSLQEFSIADAKFRSDRNSFTVSARPSPLVSS